MSWLAAELPRSTLPPERLDRAPNAELVPHAALDAAIGDLTTAIVRSGTDASETPAIVDALARIGKASRSLEVARWVGRLRAALAARDEIAIARLLHDASTIEPKDEPVRLVDHVLVELGREVLDGLTPFAIERRHLIDPASGEILSEERLRDQPASNGPCPRVVSAGFAMRTSTGRVRIVQYAVSALDAEMLARVAALASPTLSDAFGRANKTASAAVEPVSLIRLGAPAEGIVPDAAGTPIPMARHEDAAAVTALIDALAEGTPEWLLGRWSYAANEASLVPLSCCVDGRVVRLR